MLLPSFRERICLPFLFKKKWARKLPQSQTHDYVYACFCSVRFHLSKFVNAGGELHVDEIAKRRLITPAYSLRLRRARQKTEPKPERPEIDGDKNQRGSELTARFDERSEASCVCWRIGLSFAISTHQGSTDSG